MRGVPAGFRDFLLPFEGEKLYEYLDIAGRPSIYIGHLIVPGDVFLHTEEDSANYLAKDAALAFNTVERLTDGEANDNQYMAMGSFTFNEGIGAFGSSTLLKLFRAGDMQGAANQFLAWTKVHENGVMVESASLLRRRQAERALFLEAV